MSGLTGTLMRALLGVLSVFHISVAICWSETRRGCDRASLWAFDLGCWTVGSLFGVEGATCLLFVLILIDGNK